MTKERLSRVDREQASALAVAAMSPSPWWGGRPIAAVGATQLGAGWLIELVAVGVELPDSPFALVGEYGDVAPVAWSDALRLLQVI